MSTHVPDLDLDALFGDDYRHFYEPLLPDQLSDDETELILDLCGIDPGQTVLDVGCGSGRIANRLATRGCRVLGIDTSSALLDAARSDAAARGVSVDYRRADMRELDLDGVADHALCWFTTFGYFDDATNESILQRIGRAVRPGGRLLLETLNIYQAVFEEEIAEVKQTGDDFMIDRTRFDPITGRLTVRRATVRDGRTRHAEFSLRLFAVPELRDALTRAGFVDVRAFDGEGDDFATDADRLVLVAQKP